MLLQRRYVLVATAGAASWGLLAQPVASKTVELLWDEKETGGFPIAINGLSSSHQGSAFRITYKEPPPSACNRVIVYQKTGTATAERLEKAMVGTFSLSRSLDIGDRIGDGLKQKLSSGNLINTRSLAKNGSDIYFEFDVVVPSDNSIFLVSTTILNKRLYVFLLEANKDQWSVARDDLLQTRASFQVQKL